MKKILLLTDFSKRNKSAEKMALDLCSRLESELVLLYNYFALPTIPFSDGGPSTRAWAGLYQEAQQEILSQVKEIRAEIAALPDGVYRPKVNSRITEGDIGMRVCEIVPRQDIELIIMGAAGASSFEHLLFGNIVRSVIKNASCPVLVVPEQPFHKKIGKVIFATDFNKEDFNAFRYLARLSEILGLSIEAVHVLTRASAGRGELEREQAFIKHLEEFAHLNITYRDLVGESVVEKIAQLCSSANGDWLVMTEHPRSLLTTLFNKNSIKTALKAHYLPILVFPKMLLPARYFLKGKEHASKR